MGIIGGIVRRSSSETVRIEDEERVWPSTIGPHDFYIKDEENLCTPEQIAKLRACASLSFQLESFDSLAHILSELEIKVLICKGKPKKDISSLESAERYWQDMLHSNKFGAKAYKALKAIKDEKEFWGSHCIRGCYNPLTNTIKLFPEVMKDEYKGDCVDELLVTTLAHETMHAYFDRPGHDKYPYAYFVEEPMAEFGMLLYLHETRKPPFLEGWAYYDVKNKKSCYRYGAKLYDEYILGETSLRTYLEEYKWGIDSSEIPDFDSTGASSLPACPPSPVPRTIVTPAKKRLKVNIPGSVSIYEKKSCDTFVKAIDRAIDLTDIVIVYNAANAIKGGKPLISDSYEVYGKYRNTKELEYAPGFYVDTDSSDLRKKEILNKLFKKLCLDWTAEVE